MKKGIIWLFILCILCFGAALMLQFGGRKTSGTVVDTEGTEEILVVYAWEDERDTFDALTGGFNSEYPDIQIKMYYFPSEEYQQAVEIAVNGEKEIDVIATPSVPSIVHMIEKDQIAALDGIADEIDLSGIREVMDAYRWNGQYYLMPYRNSAWVVYYNKDIFDQAGAAYPPEQWTWQDYMDLAAGLADHERNVYGSLNFDISSTWWRIPARTAGAANPLTEADLQLFTEAARWNYELTYEKQAAMPYSQLTGLGGLNYIERFLNGEAAMMYGGEWCIPMLNERIRQGGLEFSYDVIPLPSWQEEKSYAIGSAATLMVAAKSKEQENGRLFIRYACGPEGAATLAEQGLLPAWDSPEIRRIFQSSLTMPEHTEYFFPGLEASDLPASSEYPAAMSLLHENIMSYLMQETGLEQAAASYQKQLRERTSKP